MIRDRDLLNTQLCTVNLRTLEMLPPQSEPHNAAISVVYDPTAKCPLWDAFLLEVLAGDPEMVAYMQRVIGYALTGHTTEHCVFVLHGDGHGKSTVLEVIRSMLGDYGKETDLSTFISIPRDFELATLQYARMVTIKADAYKTRIGGSPQQRGIFSEAGIKMATGGDAICCRHRYDTFFEYVPAFKIFMAGQVSMTDDVGIYRRVQLIPFDVKIARESMDPSLRHKLMLEWPGILAWAARGAASWFEGGLAPVGCIASAGSRAARGA